MINLADFLKRGGRVMVLDIEAVGLHGEGFAFGYQVTVHDTPVAEHAAHCSPRLAHGTPQDLKWVLDNVPAKLERSHARASPREVRDDFWECWMREKNLGTLLMADVGWPVEANFLSACIADDQSNRHWHGPYPLLDLSSILWTRGINPLQTQPRQSGEHMVHDPLHDARQSARIFREMVTGKSEKPIYTPPHEDDS